MKSGLSVGCAVLLLLVVILFNAGSDLISQRLNVQTVSGLVTDAFVKRVGESDIYHIAVTTDSGEVVVLQNKDAWTWGKWNSADIQQKLGRDQKNGVRVTLTVTGWRVPLFSWFQNIVVVEDGHAQ